MFGFSWGEIGLIMAVALIAIGPKDLPVAIRTVTGMLKKARGMASEFQGHVDEMMREANLADVKSEINKLRQFDFKGAAEQMVDPDGSLRETVTTAMDVPGDVAGAVSGAVSMVSEDLPGTRAFVPPAAVAELPVAPAFIPPDAALKKPVPPFIPPGTKRWGF
jgi:sec-independent protein translocase protein TatB